jgi:hypothetical protein
MPLAETLAAIFFHLRAALAAAAHKHDRNPPLHTLMTDAYHYAGRLSRRFVTLFQRWQAGTLPVPKPRPTTPLPPRDPTAPKRARALSNPPAVRLPRRWAALLRGDHMMSGYGSQLLHTLCTPEGARFLAEVPRAAGMVRPLLHLLGMSTFLTPLWKAPRKRAPRPPKPKPERRGGKYPRFNPRTYSPGKIPAFKKPSE